MIKFSDISGTKINSEPKIEISKESIELEGFKQSIMDMIEKTLIVRNEGNYRHTVFISKIDGKEMFVEALLDFLSEKENKKAITYLESLKESNNDWKSIDEKIDEIKENTEKIKFLSDNNSHVEQIKSFLDKYALSEDFTDILDNQLLKITDYNIALTRSKVANLMMESDKYPQYQKNKIKTIANKFMFRSTQIKAN